MTPPTIKAIRAIDDRLIFELDQDREVSLPVSASARLAIWEVLGIAEDAYLRWLQEAPVS